MFSIWNLKLMFTNHWLIVMLYPWLTSSLYKTNLYLANWCLGCVFTTIIFINVIWCCYLGHEALCDGHRVGVTLLEDMQKVPEWKTLRQGSHIGSWEKVNVSINNTKYWTFSFFPTIHCVRTQKSDLLWTGVELPWIHSGSSHMHPCVCVCVCACVSKYMVR